jgi:hypothetical protein
MGYSILAMTRTAIFLLMLCWLAANQTPQAGNEHKQPNDAGTNQSNKGQESSNGAPAIAGNKTVNGATSTPESQSQRSDPPNPSHDWIDKVNAFSTLIIAVFTILLFFGVARQISTSRDIERAWVLGELRWHEGKIGRILEGSSTTLQGMEETSSITVKLTYKNEGKTPAWIEDISSEAQILSLVELDNPPAMKPRRNPRTVTVIGPGTAQSKDLTLECPGKMRGPKDCIYIRVLIQYRDIFRRHKMTHLGYAIGKGGYLTRVDIWSAKSNRDT